jgi:hypothetical protein
MIREAIIVFFSLGFRFTGMRVLVRENAWNGLFIVLGV